MKYRNKATIAALALAAALATPAYAGDNEPAGGAFMSSYIYPGSTGDAIGSRPRSVDIPENGYGQGDFYFRGNRTAPPAPAYQGRRSHHYQ